MRHIQNTAQGVLQLWNRQKDIRVDIQPGINHISDEHYELFAEKIKANPSLFESQEVFDMPVKANKSNKKQLVEDSVEEVEQEAEEVKEEEVPVEEVAEDKPEEDKPSGRSGRRR